MAVPPNESSATLNGPTRTVPPALPLPAGFEDELCEFIRAAGFPSFDVSFDVRSYGDDDGDSWTSNVFTITVKHAERDALGRLTLDLIDYLDDHEDERVRKGVSVHVQ